MIDFVVDKITGFIFGGLASIGYWVCLFTALGGHLAYLSGFKKGTKYTMFSTVIYTVLQALDGAMK